MRDFITNGNLAMISATYKQEDRGWTKSYFLLDQLAHIEKDKFAFLIPNFSNNEISLNGALTWGDSGFNFLIKSTLVNSATPIIEVQQHSDIGTLQIDILHDIIGVILKLANHKITTDKNLHPKEIATFRAPTLAAYKRHTKYTSKHQENIERHIKNKVFDKIFGEILISHLDKGLRCRG
ncbi:TPA: hypothetical protein ACT9H1_000925 [Legionella pneumophila]|uniref:hypothetical protein n=1 Tax=Legionella pneumophila TaxID=446 RepID=UPI00077089AE|nr:hypothetical protein [Legionella pneumophila]CZI74358.1 Uncharacterised protein [Legionella pneumophila]HAU0782091.1 hypothetical protein [Legionella pneumophila]HAU1223962.1 hypothetical protein [Legionella pneumophila]